jgi:hypothetical protein
MQDWKMTDKIGGLENVGVENERLEIDGLEIERLWKMQEWNMKDQRCLAHAVSVIGSNCYNCYNCCCKYLQIQKPTYKYLPVNTYCSCYK